MPLLLGIDVGTTGCKALLLEAGDGRLVAEGFQGYPLATPRPLWAEQDPADWWAAACAAIRQVVASSGARSAEIIGVGLTGQMHGLVMLDRADEVLRPAILWNDQRTGAECEAITRLVGASRVLELTGNPVLTGFTAPKIAWVRKHERDVFEQTAHVLLPKDYVRHKLTGEHVCDVSDASGTALFDVKRRAWSDEMAGAVDVKPSWLPRVLESGEKAGQVTPAAAAATGLARGTPVAAGAGDQAAQAIGSGIVADSQVALTLGTSGVVFAACGAYRAEPEGRLHAFCHAAPGTWHLMGVMLSAGGSLKWYRDSVCEGADYAALLSPAERVPPGCEGLVFLPYLSGERTPHADPNARAVFFGLTLRHGRSHLTRAVLEGVCFGLRDSLELIRGLGIRPQEIRISGGGAQSALWRGILANVLGCPLVGLKVNQGAAYGAALLAGVAVGAFADARAASAHCVQLHGRTEPGEEREAYERHYARFRALYPALKQEFARADAAAD